MKWCSPTSWKDGSTDRSHESEPADLGSRLLGHHGSGLAAAGILYPSFGILLSPVVAALAMPLSSVSVIANALRLRSVRL